MSPNLIGAFLMVAGMAAFTLNDTFVKLTGGEVPLFQLIFLRGVLSSGMILVLARSIGPLRFRLPRRDWALITLRGIAEIAGAYFFLSALFNMPIGNLTAILQVLPLTVTLASAVVLREAVGWRRVLAIAIGFGGVLLIVRPGAEGFNVWSLYALIAVCCVTVRDLSTRVLSAAVPGITVTLTTSVLVMVAAGLASLAQPWAAVTPQVGGLIAVASFFIVGGYYCSIQAMRVGEVSFVAPFRYAGLIAAMLVGYLVFGEVPRALTLLGAAIVVGTGLFTLYREQRARRLAP
ncbi:EamA family transporter [Sulfitobacter sp. SK012]|uniref:DMT family transporter n=1 Tax=Sulfitobacter sp. SK012 TaxID=1389005 RepID=UPI000E09F8AC|nr:DMT family transporter [Sulfitobacter sp. SK012]AXI48717.1 EamA family transporter [Sulfitobacter sp. SK012]